jgi:hypothetical protein
MVESDVVTGELATARRLVDLLERDGYGLDSAVWVVDDEGQGRLYLVPRKKGESHLKETIRVAYTITAHKDELPDRHDLRYSIVESSDPVIQAVRSATGTTGKLRGIYKDGTYIDTAYVLRPAA